MPKMVWGVARRIGRDLGRLQFSLLLKDDHEQVETIAQSAGDSDRVVAGELV